MIFDYHVHEFSCFGRQELHILLHMLNIIHVMSSYTYKLELSNIMKIHNVFHTSLLQSAANSNAALPGQINEEQSSVEMNNQNK